MPTYGLTGDGFLPKSLTVIRDDINKAILTAFNILPGDKTILGQLIGIIAALFAELWEQLEAVYSSRDPNKARGAAQDAVCAITGTQRPAASYSAVTMTLFGTPSSPVNDGTRFHAATTGNVFATDGDTTIEAVADWAPSTSYSVGDRVFWDIERIYECTVEGISAASGGPSNDAPDIVDGTVHWKPIQSGLTAPAGCVDVVAKATVTGPVTAVAGDITEIDTPVAGLVAVVNLTDATPGRDVATDEELAVLREQELSADGQTPADAIRAAIRRINGGIGIKSCTVFENIGDETDENGLPPHTVEVLVQTTWAEGDDNDQLIFDTIQKNLAAGIGSYGTTSGTALDSEGVEKTIYFSRPETKDIYVHVNLLVDPENFPSDGTDLASNEIVTWGDAQGTGKDAVARAIGSRAFRVDGVLDAEVFIDLAPAPATSTTIPISRRQIADYDSSRITYTVTEGEP